MKLIEIDENEWRFVDASLTFDFVKEFDEVLNLRKSGRSQEAESLMRALLDTCPNHIDALHHLGLWRGNEGQALQSYVLCQAAVAIGLHAIPPRFSWESSKLSWLELDNRPFLRAYHCLGIWRMDQGLWDQAIEIFARLLQVNPNDNQGVRYLLPRCWFEKDDIAAVAEHCRKFPEDHGAEILYSRALALVFLGKVEKARKAVAKCVEFLPLVAEELLKSNHPEPYRKYPGMITIGGADQAWEYWRVWGRYWKQSEKAMGLLRAVSD